MKSMKKIMVTVLAVVMMVATFAGCGQKFDAAAYVTSCMDLLTKGETKQYTKTTGRTEEEAQQDYEANIDSMMSAMGDISMTEDLENGYRQLFKDLYKNAKYEVTGAEKMEDEDGYTVTIEIQQMTGFFDGVQDELMTQATDYVNGLSEMPSDDELNEAIYQMMLDLLEANLSEITYNDAQTITVEVMGDDGVYSITDEGYTAIDDALLDVSGLQNKFSVKINIQRYTKKGCPQFVDGLS